MSTPATVDHLPGKLNLKFRQGNDFSSTVQIGTKTVSQDGKVTFVPKDVTGSTFELYIAGFDNRGKATVVTPADGTVNMSVGHDLTSQMRGSIAYELVEIYADKTRKTILNGLMKVETPCDDETSCNCHSCGCHVDDCQCKDAREIVPCNPTGVISLNGRTGAVLIDDLIPQANTTVAGIVKVDGVTVKIDANGVLSASITNTSGANGTPYVLPPASTTQMGGVIVGGGLRVAPGGVISSPIATPGTVGVVKPGSLLSILADGTIDVAGTPAHTHQISQISGLQADLDGKADIYSGKVLPAVLPIANTTQRGAVKPDGTTVTIDADGTIHAVTIGITGGTVTSAGLDLSTTAGNIFSVTGSPVTKAGNITLGLDNQAPHMVLAGPAFGAPTAPAFRSLTGDDISDATAIGLSLLRSATISGVTTTLGLANVSLTGSYRDLADKPVIPANYTLPTASTVTLGGVKIDGTTIKIDANGTISGSNATTYTLPTANATRLGGVKQGANTTIDANGVIDVTLPASAGTYVLPPANTTTLGGVIPSGNITVSTLGKIDANLSGYVPVESTTATKIHSSSSVMVESSDTKGDAFLMMRGSGSNDVTLYMNDPAKSYDWMFHMGPSPEIQLSIDTSAAGQTGQALLNLDASQCSVNLQAANNPSSGLYTQVYLNAKQKRIHLLSQGAVEACGPTSVSLNSSSTSLVVTPLDAVLNAATGRTWSANSILTKGHADTTYIVKPTAATANQILTYNGTGWDSANAPSVTLPIATNVTLGGVKQGPNVTISATGEIDVTMPTPAGTYTLPIATPSILGGVKPSGNITVNANGFMDVSVPSGAGTYVLPAANATRLGGITVGANLSVTGAGLLDVNIPTSIPLANVTGLQIANVTTAGLVYPGDSSILIDATGNISVNDPITHTTANATFQARIANTTYGLTDTPIPLATNHVYVVGDHLDLSATKKFYIGQRGRKMASGSHSTPTSYGLGGYVLDSGGLPTGQAYLDNTGAAVSINACGTLATSNPYATVSVAPNFLVAKSSNGTGENQIKLSDGAIEAVVVGGGTLKMFPTTTVLGPNANDYHVAVGQGATTSGGIQFKRIAKTAPVNLDYKVTSSTGTYQFDSGMFFGDGDEITATTSINHSLTNTATSAVTATNLTLGSNNATLTFTNTPSWSNDSILIRSYGDTRYLQAPASATANQVLTYNGTAWGAANATGLTQVTANLLYQPIMKGAAYHNAIPIPAIGTGVASYEGEIYKDLSGTQGSGGNNATFLCGVTHHGTLPGVPFGYVMGNYFTDPVAGTIVSQRTVYTDQDSVYMTNKGSSLGPTNIRVRTTAIEFAAFNSATTSSQFSLSGSSGLLYTPPANVPVVSNMMLNKGQMDSMYLPVPANATLGQIIMSNGTGYGPAAFGKQTLVDAPTIAWLADPLKVAVLFLSTTRQIAFPTGPGLIPGATYNLIVVQSVGSASLTWQGNYFFPNKVRPVLSTAANSIDIFSFIYDGTNMYGTMQKSFGIGV